MVWLENYLSRDDARPDYPRAGFYMGQAMWLEWFCFGIVAGLIISRLIRFLLQHQE